jgi:hypothetical protein
MFRDFYATAAQVLPVLMLAFVWESRFLDRLVRERRLSRRFDPDGVVFWTKSRVRLYTMFVATAISAGTATAVLVLAGAVRDSVGVRAGVTGCVLLAVATLMFRITVDVTLATRQPPDAGATD